MENYQGKYSKYKKKYYDLKGGAPLPLNHVINLGIENNANSKIDLFSSDLIEILTNMPYSGDGVGGRYKIGGKTLSKIPRIFELINLARIDNHVFEQITLEDVIFLLIVTSTAISLMNNDIDKLLSTSKLDESENVWIINDTLCGNIRGTHTIPINIKDVIYNFYCFIGLYIKNKTITPRQFTVIPLSQDKLNSIRILSETDTTINHKRNGHLFTNRELGIAIGITQISSNDEDSYLTCLNQVFSGPRSDVLLEHILS